MGGENELEIYIHVCSGERLFGFVIHASINKLFESLLILLINGEDSLQVKEVNGKNLFCLCGRGEGIFLDSEL